VRLDFARRCRSRLPRPSPKVPEKARDVIRTASQGALHAFSFRIKEGLAVGSARRLAGKWREEPSFHGNPSEDLSHQAYLPKPILMRSTA